MPFVCGTFRAMLHRRAYGAFRQRVNPDSVKVFRERVVKRISHPPRQPDRLTPLDPPHGHRRNARSLATRSATVPGPCARSGADPRASVTSPDAGRQ